MLKINRKHPDEACTPAACVNVQWVGYKALRTHEHRCKKKMTRKCVVNCVRDVTMQMSSLQTGEVAASSPAVFLGVMEDAAPVFQIKEDAAPVFQIKEDAAPVFQIKEDAAPVFQVMEDAVPVFQVMEDAAPVFQVMEDAAPVFHVEEKAAPNWYEGIIPVENEGGALAFSPSMLPEPAALPVPADVGGETPLRDEVTSPVLWVRETRGWEVEPREKGTDLDARLEEWRGAYQVHIEEGRMQVEEIKACTRCGFREGAQGEQMDWRLVKFKKAEEAVRWIKMQIKESKGKVGIEELCRRTKERYMEIGPSTHVRTIIMGIMVGMEAEEPVLVNEGVVDRPDEQVQTHRVSTQTVLSGKDLEAMDQVGFQSRRMKHKKKNSGKIDEVNKECEALQIIEVGLMEDFEVVPSQEEVSVGAQSGEVTCSTGNQDDFSFPLTEEDLMDFIA